MNFEQQLLAQHGGDRVATATATAKSLMAGDPATFKRGYSIDNAVLAVQDLFGLNADETEAVRTGIKN